MLNRNMMCILFLGWVVLAASSVKVYYFPGEDSSSSDSKSLEANNRIRLLKEMISRMQEIQSNLPDNKKNEDIFEEKQDYDYDGYYVGKSNKMDKHKNCKGTNCMLLIPGKAPWVVTDNKANSRYRSGKVKQFRIDKSESKAESSGYEADDEGEDVDIPIVRTKNCNNVINSDCQKPCQKRSPGCRGDYLRTTTKAPTTTKRTNATTKRRTRVVIRYVTHKPLTTTTTRKKTFNEKTTAEITSADLDMYIPDSFEQRAGKDERKFSTDYLDIDYLMRTYIKENNTNSDHSRALDSAGKLPNPVINKEILTSLRAKPVHLHDNNRKLVSKKNKAEKPKDPNWIENESENDSNTSEKSSEYKTINKMSIYQKNAKTKNLKRKKLNLFKILNSVNTYASNSEKSKKVVLPKGNSETEESLSVEVKPKKMPLPRIPAATSSKFYYLMDTSSSKSDDNESFEANKRIRLLKEMIRSMQEKQSNHPDKKKDNNILANKYDYDYDGYYSTKTGNLNKQKNCTGVNCILLIPSKAPSFTDDKSKSRYRSGKIKNYKIDSSKSKTKHNRNSGYATISPTGLDSFEQTSGKDERKFSTDYIDVDYLLRTDVKNNNTVLESAGKLTNSVLHKALLRSTYTKPVNLHENSRKWVRIKKNQKAKKITAKQSDSDNESDSEPDSKRFFLKLTKNKANRHATKKKHQSRQSDSESENDSNEKMVRKKKNKASRGKASKKVQTKQSESNSENDSNTSQERSSEYRTTTKKPKYQKSKSQYKKKKKIPSRFNIVDSLNTYTSDSEEPEVIPPQKGSTETIEPVSVEVKPKKKSKPRIPGKPEHYMQGPSRLYKEGRDFRKKKEVDHLARDIRKRMPHFLPKRYHWDPSDFHRLGYFWYNGPQGKVPGPWKISY